MRTKHIAAADWRRTLDALSRSVDGAIISLEILSDELGAEAEVSDQPLRGISADSSGMTIQIEKRGGLRMDHRVAHPAQLRIIENDEGAVLAVEIEDREGVHSLVPSRSPERFRSPLRPDILARSAE